MRSNILLFAYDTQIFRRVSTIEDADALQKDIDAFNLYNLISCTHIATSFERDELEHVFEEKDLGVVIDMELTIWRRHGVEKRHNGTHSENL